MRFHRRIPITCKIDFETGPLQDQLAYPLIDRIVLGHQDACKISRRLLFGRLAAELFIFFGRYLLWFGRCR